MREASLLDLRFGEFDVLARDRVVFILLHFLGHGARILLGDVIVAGVGARHELHFQCDGLRHVSSPFGFGRNRVAADAA